MLAAIWILIGAFLLGYYSGLLLLDDKTPESDISNKKIEEDWHFVGSLIFIYISLTAWLIWGPKFIPFALCSFWVVYAGIVHRVGLNKPFFFVGTTAKTDIIFRKIFSKNTELYSGIIKSLFFVVSVCLLFFL